jgi:hypothetical protein
MWNMSAVQTFDTDRVQQAIRFVLVNNRVPSTNPYCVLCGELVERDYVRDVQTRLVYCDTQCFTAWTNVAARVANGRGRKAS